MKSYHELTVFLLFSIIITTSFHEIQCLHLTSDKISIELNVGVNSTNSSVHDARLECHYDLDDDTLYEIKWYKDSREFYRYAPNEDPKIKTFVPYGLSVDIFKSNSSVVVLKSGNKSSSGSYRCEVTGEPSYKTVHQEAEWV